jgi:hypothetical protein
MPLFNIHWDKECITENELIAIRDVLHEKGYPIFGVKQTDVIIRAIAVGPLDLHYRPIGIEIETHVGENRNRVENERLIVLKISEALLAARVLKKEWTKPDESYVWLKLFEGTVAFIVNPSAP